MSLKLFGGFAKGFTLQTPNSISYRPTQTTLRRKFFDKYQDLSGYIFVDLCAGSGAVGLEALSHGADKMIAIENNPKHFGLLRKNISAFESKFNGDYTIECLKLDCFKWLEQNKSVFRSNHIILFFDPPYEMINLYQQFLQLLESESSIDAVILIEADKQKTFSEEVISSRFDVKKIFKQGTNFIVLI